MNEPQLMKSRQTNSNSGNTLRHRMLNARSFAKVFYFGRGEFKCAFGQEVPPPSQTSSSGTTETTSGWECVLDSTGPGLQSPLCSVLS